jgi:hypothetical protein
MTRNFKDAGTIASIVGHFEGQIGRNKQTSLGNTKELKTLKISEKLVLAYKAENQKKKQTNEKQSRRRKSNPTDDPKFQRCRNNCKHVKLCLLR